MSLLKKIGMSLASFGLAFALNLESRLYAEIYVPGNYPTIQSAIDANDTIDSDRILVASGEYTISEPITYRGKNITLKSEEGAEKTIINGNYQTRIFVFNSGETNEAVLEGFTITRGYAPYYGAGIYCQESSPIIKHNIIVKNETYGGGSGGGIACVRGRPLIMSNVISRNVGFSEGGGIYCEGSQAQILDNIIKENSAWVRGGGIGCWGGSPVIIRENYIINNFVYEDGGGIFLVGSDAVIENNIITKNRAEEDGGAIDSWYSSVYIIGNTIVDNSAYYIGGGIQFYFSPDFPGATGSLIAFNNIVWGNRGGPNDLSDTGPSNVFYNCLSQLEYCGINNNICADPLFVNPTPDSNTLDTLIENGDYDGAMKYLKECYSLQPDSNCIDTGDPDYLLDPDGTRADIGAIYFDQYRNKFIRGDVNRDGKVDIEDAVTILYHLPDKKFECLDSVDIDDNGKTDENDFIYLFDFLYRNGHQPPAPFPEAGYDLTPDTLACYVCKTCENADLDDDWKVNFSDYSIIANNWLKAYSPNFFRGDIYEDNKIDFRDLKNIAENWLWRFSWPSYED